MLALLYDVHGNLPALDAVLADADAAGAERFLLGGDYAVFGAWPVETIARLRTLDATWIRGNVDRWAAQPDEEEIPGAVRAAVARGAELLGPDTVTGSPACARRRSSTASATATPRPSPTCAGSRPNPTPRTPSCSPAPISGGSSSVTRTCSSRARPKKASSCSTRKRRDPARRRSPSRLRAGGRRRVDRSAPRGVRLSGQRRRGARGARRSGRDPGPPDRAGPPRRLIDRRRASAGGCG